MNLGSERVYVYRCHCPPNTWEWPPGNQVIVFFKDSPTHKEFLRRLEEEKNETQNFS
jgi:hypothetical protein